MRIEELQQFGLVGTMHWNGARYLVAWWGAVCVGIRSRRRHHGAEWDVTKAEFVLDRTEFTHRTTVGELFTVGELRKERGDGKARRRARFSEHEFDLELLDDWLSDVGDGAIDVGLTRSGKKDSSADCLVLRGANWFALLAQVDDTFRQKRTRKLPVREAARA